MGEWEARKVEDLMNLSIRPSSSLGGRIIFFKFIYAGVTQLIECSTCNRVVGGLNPSTGSIF